MNKFLLSSILLISFSTFGANLDILISGQANTVYSKEDRNTYVKEFSELSAKVDVTIEDAGTKRTISKTQPTSRDKSTGLKSITLLKNNFVQFVDKQEDEQGNISNIDSKVRGLLLKKGIFSKIIGLKISATTLESLYEAELEAQGLNVLKGLTGSFDDLSISTDVKFGDMECTFQDKGMTCIETFSISVNATDEK